MTERKWNRTVEWFLIGVRIKRREFLLGKRRCTLKLEAKSLHLGTGLFKSWNDI